MTIAEMIPDLLDLVKHHGKIPISISDFNHFLIHY